MSSIVERVVPQQTAAASDLPAASPVAWSSRPAVLLTAFMGLLVLGLAGLSLRWPIVGDASMFQFAAAQFRLGAVPYRDFTDMNMPLIYGIHAAVIALGGLGDGAFRTFDLGSAVAIGALAALLVRPRGWVSATLAALGIGAAHLLFGPSSAGERDFLLLMPVLAAALLLVATAERPRGQNAFLCAAGFALGLAMLLKPTAILLMALPAVVLRPTIARLASLMIGAAVPLLATALVLAHLGGLPAFVEDLREFTPYYAALADRPWPVLLAVAAKQAFFGVGGLALAALFGLRQGQGQGPRARVLIALIGFGVIHIVVQGKGFFYHAYPLIAGLVCFGAWSLPALSPRILRTVCLLSALVFGWEGVQAARLSWGSPDLMMPTPATRAMTEALQSRLPPGARVQMLDMSGGAFLAMARSGMRQATPFAYWLYLDPGKPAWRASFLQQLRENRPDAILVTDANWPTNNGLAAIDQWDELQGLLSRCYDRAEDQRVRGTTALWSASSFDVAWRLYMPRSQSPGGC